jgi:hypothetical protein
MKRAAWLFFILFFVFFCWLALASSSLAGGEDGVMHHLFARYSPEHPENFLDLWAKPLYTLLSMPFARFGFFGSQLFNILGGLGAAWLTWKSAGRLGMKRPWLAAILLVFSTQYFFVIPSSVTEILFSLLLVAALFFLLDRKYILAAVLISFIPYVRTEGNALIVMFALALAGMRQWKALPFLLLGTFCYSLAGIFAKGDFFWIWNNHPYGDASHIYGSGNLFHYVLSFRGIWGLPLTIMLLIGTFSFVVECYRVITGKKEATPVFFILLFAVFGSFYVYLAGHSYVWWKGLSGSFGLIRVMAGTMPLAALIGLYGLNLFLSIFNPLKNQRFQHGITSILVVLVVYACIKEYSLPFRGDEEKKQFLRAGEWYLSSPYAGDHKVYYFAPSITLGLGIDPFDTEKRGQLHEVIENSSSIAPGSIIIWDAHYGPHEARVPLDSLKQRKDLEEIAHLTPGFDLRTINNLPYEIYIFRRKE